MYKTANGGITITAGDYEIKQINAYSCGYETVTASGGEQFENWDFTTVPDPEETEQRERFTANVTSSNLSEEDKAALITALAPRVIEFTCPDFSGKVKISNVKISLQRANRYCKLYSVSFSAAAVEDTAVSGGL